MRSMNCAKEEERENEIHENDFLPLEEFTR